MSETTTITAPKSETKPSRNGRRSASSNGKHEKAERHPALSLRFQQVRILKALTKAGRPMTRAEITEKANVSGGMTAHLGPVIKEDISEVEKNNKQRCLLGLGYVRFAAGSDENVANYEITGAGTKALAVLASDPSWPAGH